MKVDQEFIDKTKPSWERICEKNGYGVSDGMNLAYYVVKDFATKVTIGIQMVSGMNKLIKLASNAYIERKNTIQNNINNTAPVQQPAAQNQQQQSQPQPVEETVVEPQQEQSSNNENKKEELIETAVIISEKPIDPNREPDERKQ
jgi:hypothetical protein